MSLRNSTKSMDSYSRCIKLLILSRYNEEVAARSELAKLKNQLENDLKSTASQLESEVERRNILDGMILI